VKQPKERLEVLVTENNSNTTVLELIHEDSNSTENGEVCEWQKCEAPAEYWLICPECGAREFQCAEHSLMIRMASSTATVIFDLSCQHTVRQCDCLTEKI
jgi:hypothetical protein